MSNAEKIKNVEGMIKQYELELPIASESCKSGIKSLIRESKRTLDLLRKEGKVA